MVIVELEDAAQEGVIYHVNVGNIDYMTVDERQPGTYIYMSSNSIHVKESPADIAQKVASVMRRESTRRTIVG